MKVFLYRCPDCATEIEDISSGATIRCDCKGPDSPYFQRVYGLSGVSFRGRGFYKTDK